MAHPPPPAHLLAPRPVLLHSREEGEQTAAALFNEGSPVKDIVVDFLSLRDVRRLRVVSRESVALLATCTLAEHFARGGLAVRDPRDLRPLHGCFPCLQELIILVDKAWTESDFVEAARFRAVYLISQEGLTDAMLAPLTGKLVNACVSGSAVTDGGLAALAGAGRVSFDGCDHITDVGVAMLVGVTDLRLIKCAHITDAGVATLAGLRRLYVRDVPLTGACLTPLAPYLRRLDICVCASLAHLPLLPVLEELLLSSTPLDLSCLAESVPALLSLECSCFDVSALDLSTLSRLRQLTVFRCALDEAFLSTIPECVQEISLEDIEIEGFWMDYLRHARVVSLTNVFHGDGYVLVDADDFAGFRSADDFDFSELDGEVGGALAHMPALRKLTMRPGQFSLTDMLQLHTLETLCVKRRTNDPAGTLTIVEEMEEEGEGDLDGARALATLPLTRPNFKVFDFSGGLCESKWMEAIDAFLRAVCVPGNGLHVSSSVETGAAYDDADVQIEVVQGCTYTIGRVRADGL